MANEQERSYSDREFALILNRAAELGASAESPPRRRTGLSLEEIKAIALEAGFDPGSDLLPEDAKEAIGHGVRARRSKSGAVRSPVQRRRRGPPL